MLNSLMQSLKLLGFLLGVPFGLALLLQWIGGGIRKSGVSRLGRALLLDWIGAKLLTVARSLFGKGYDFVLLPGTMCRGAGEALGCLIISTKMSCERFEVFNLGFDDVSNH